MLLAGVLFCLALTDVSWLRTVPARAQTTPSTVIVSAAGFAAPLTPDGIAAAFGMQLATATETGGDADPNEPGVQLPTTLAGTSVEVNGRPAGLFFVSPGQINFLIPAATETGTANVVIRSGAGVESRTTVEIVEVAPQLFSVGSEGRIPAALLLRVRGSGEQVFEDPYSRDPATGNPTALRVDFGPDEDRLFLVLLLCGVRRAPDSNSDGNVGESVIIPVGGLALNPAFAGAQGDFLGLDQINLELPRSLINRGRINLAVTAEGFDNPRVYEIEIADARGPAPPEITALDPPTAFAGEAIRIRGRRFAANLNENVARVGGREARITAIDPERTELTVLIPFGADSGPVTVRTPFGSGQSPQDATIRTSISGTLETTDRQPLPQSRVTLRNTSASILTNGDGSFVLPATPTSVALIEITGPPVTPPFPRLLLKAPVAANRDNALEWVAMQQATGDGLPVGGGSFASSTTAPAQSIEIDQVRFEVGFGTAVFPDGAQSGLLFLSVLRNSRTPTALPGGVFSSAIAQLTPFGVRLQPGGTLTFPNRDGLLPNARAPLYKFDQDPASPTVGEFVIVGQAQVSPDGSSVETEPGAVTETSIYFVGARPPATTIVGRVVESADGAPIRDAVVRVNSRETRTDGNGGFILPNITLRPIAGGGLEPPVNAARRTAQRFLPLTLEVFVHRPSQRVDRASVGSIIPFAGGVTSISGPIVVPSEMTPRPPSVLISNQVRITEGTTQEIRFIADDLDSDLPPQVTASGADFASITSAGDINFILRLAPMPGTSGQRTLFVTARAASGLVSSQEIALQIDSANRPPTLNAPATVSGDEGQTLSFVLTANDPDGDPLVFAAGQLPPGANFLPDSRMFQWLPGFEQAGVYQASFTVTDNGAPPLSDTRTVEITVRNVNRPPLIAVNSSYSGAEGAAITFRLLATDPDGDDIRCNSPNLPAGAIFNQTSCIFTWTPDFTQAGTYSVQLIATDNGTPPRTSSRNVTLNIADTNRPPVLNVPPTPAASLGVPLSFNVSATDPDNDPLTLSATNLPPGAMFDPMTGLFTWNPSIAAFKQESLVSVTFAATEDVPSGATTSIPVPIRVQVGDWVASGSLNTGRAFHSSNLLANGRVVVAGGVGFSATALASAEIFDPSGNAWTLTGSLNDPRLNHTGTTLDNGQVLVAGGLFLSGTLVGTLESAELYDPTMGQWLSTGNLGQARERHTSTLLQNGMVLAAGGRSNGSAIASAELFNPLAGLWNPAAGINTPRFDHTATLLANGMVLVVGGMTGVGVTASAEIYNPMSNSWAPTGSLIEARSAHTATLLADGRVLVAGGTTTGGAQLASAEIYDPGSGAWSSTGAMMTARVDHTAGLVRNGRVLVAGGRINGTALTTSEWYDPVAGVWLRTDDLNAARSGHRMTILADHRALASGGVGALTSIASSEFLDPNAPFTSVVRISNLQLNGGTFFAAVSAGSMVSIGFDYFIRDPGCPGCIDQIEIGLHNGPPTSCGFDGIPGVVGVSGSAFVNITAPVTPGTYFVTFDRSQHFSCAQALATGNWWNFQFPAPVTNFIGILIVQ